MVFIFVLMKMDSSMVQHEFKLKKLLKKFLVPGYRLGNDVYLNILLSHLSSKEDESQAQKLKELPLFTEWLEEAITLWETMSTPSASIATFTLNLASLISVNETIFYKLNCKNIYVRICKVLKIRSTDTTPAVKLGYLKMLHSFLSHKSGLNWLSVTDYWNDILIYCLENQTIYVTRDGYNFMFEFLSKVIEENSTFCEIIVKKIIANLEASQFNQNGLVQTEIDDVQIQKDLMPTLKLTIFILEKCYLSSFRHEYRTLPDIFLKNYNIGTLLWNLLIVARDTEFIFNISKAIFIALFLKINIDEDLKSIETCIPVFIEFAQKFFELFNTLINKENAVNVVRLCQWGHTYWAKISHLVPPCPSKEEPLLFENQLIIFQIMPILNIAFNSDNSLNNTDELTDMFINKLFKISCEDTIRCAYSYRTLLRNINTTNAFELGQKAIFYLMKTRQQLHRDRAVIVFQALVYAMKNLSKAIIDKSQMAIDLLTYQSGFLSAMFDGLSMLIKDFKITWRESVETICLTSMTMDFLKCPNLPNKLSVQSLQLLHLTIANFMPPNLALLVDEVSDSSITTITPMIYKKLHDSSWEIRDSVLEILQTVVDIAHLKFPAFQKMIVDDRLCQLAVILSTDDSESFVRASAIKSLTVMIKVPAFWINCLECEQLPEKMMMVLQNETEAIVRCQAAKLICEIYENQLISSDLIMTVYKSMAAAVCHDLHWEVKVNALNFWDKVIIHEMSNQGMIDGVFPSVTFSKENKKIVTLTEPEIQNRLNKVLFNLSEYTCLGVLLNAIHDDCDLEVSRKAVEITKKLTELLKKYSMLTSNVNTTTLNRGVWDTFCNFSRNTSRESDASMAEDVIDSIVNCSDMKLLASVCKEEVNFKQVNGDVKVVKIISPEEFKKFVIRDLDSLVDERKKWLASVDDLGSLLDDILQSYEENDVNSMDCY